ncbi:hypothetical protein SERLADRAFT_368911 [Serpula lacrymans var. lacrymans S7.9]|uniref:Glutamine amidotransferase type-2 domain-containing protein n=1 Tax=Serpula lacrymans var. lacrymans (strain S7.9) TaxID=578457 RepID=F8NT44_SERL9|nr:uncharacterized protein SERLADRAFT_368911 [Serpula lacrymans var. lacrymans S7.9]EGO25517.1 hypothetical protein SERLADRAFT_368911 [Serpula lacrymans var. lacrymans S7.9]
MFASELRLRGQVPIVQPHQADGNILCWNGEVFEGMDIHSRENDGVRLFKAMCLLEAPSDIPSLLGRIEGPYAFVFYHATSQSLYFARDPLGRRSLLIHRPTKKHPYLLLTSVSVGVHSAYEVEELSTDGIFCLDLANLNKSPEVGFLLASIYLELNGLQFASSFDGCLTTFPRCHQTQQFAQLSKVKTTLPTEDIPQPVSLELERLPDNMVEAMDQLLFHLDRSVMLRVRDIPRGSDLPGQARLAVLFSGGIDSTMIAFLAHRHIPLDEPIDLLNVAFENPRKIQVQTEGNIGAMSKKKKQQRLKISANKGTENTSYMVPDRLTGLKEVEELRRVCPGRTWNFVEVNVRYEESRAARTGVEETMFPGRTVMDLSLAMALYFASRGVGQIRSEVDPDGFRPYESPARVMLNGLGSDELLGGYGRHRTAFGVRGWQGVIDELQLELDRIPTRNLGRDDRVISSNGKETRHPFLSLSLVAFLAQLPVHLKLDPRLEIGTGDKMLLRAAARKVGLLEASERKKRAMQFGSHSARMEAGDGERRGDLLIGGRTVTLVED